VLIKVVESIQINNLQNKNWTDDQLCR
jgi:hypothetical protein